MNFEMHDLVLTFRAIDVSVCFALCTKTCVNENKCANALHAE